jgi:hypothetical protein
MRLSEDNRVVQAVCTEKLGPDVLVVKAAENRSDFEGADALKGTTNRRIFGRRPWVRVSL